MSLIAVVYGDWRPSPAGTRSHYGHGPVALCGSPRTVNDSKVVRDRCTKCLKIKWQRRGQYIS